MSVDEFQVQDGYECPTCENVLNTSLGLKQHHTKVHDESLVETMGCEVCGTEFIVRPCQDNRHTCSMECKGKRRSVKGVPARKRRVTEPCKGCGEDMELRPSEVGHKVYCSDDCRRDGEFIDCEVCGSEFYAYDTYADKARFCSQDCYGEWLSENRSGENSWHWKGDDRFTDRVPYGSGWTETKREQVRERDGRECTDCGMGTSTHRERFSQKLHVHHEVDPRESTNPAVHNAPRNLRTLCVRCHLSVTHTE